MEPAAAQSQGSSGDQGSSVANKGGQAAGGEILDFKKAFESQQAELSGTKQAIEKIGKEFSAYKQEASKDLETFSRLKEVLGGEQKPKERDYVAECESQLEHYLAEAVEAEKRGQPIPLTTNLAVRFFQSEIEKHTQKRDFDKKLSEMERALKQATNPQATIDHTAYGNIDNFLMQGLDSLYGVEETSLEVKSHLFQTVASQIAKGLQELQQTNPTLWDRVRRNPNDQRKIVNDYLKRNLPPQAVKIIEQQRLAETPMPLSELWQAFREAASIEDVEKRREIRTQIRQEILDRMYNREEK